jgi:hypothetical protein
MIDLRMPALAALAVGAVLGYQISAGGLDYTPAAVANPCHPQPWTDTHGLTDVENRVALSALAGAACKLDVSREDLVLAFATDARLAEFKRVHHLTDQELGDAAKAGLIRAIDDAERAGRLNGFEAVTLRFAAEHVPADQIIPLVRRLLG